MELATKSAVRTCGLSFSGHLMMYTTDKAMSQPCQMLVYDLRDDSQIRTMTHKALNHFSTCDLVNWITVY